MNKQELQEVFYYDETSPTFIRWKIDRMSGRKYTTLAAKAGDCAGTLSSNGRYFDVYFNRKLVRVHKVVAILVDIEIPEGCIVDHEDGNSLNNKKSNLRALTQVRNCRNRRKQHNNTSGTAGVNRKTEKTGQSYWVARWNTQVGSRASKTFSISLHGEQTAYDLAVKYRLEKIKELNSLGYGYTERHGK